MKAVCGSSEAVMAGAGSCERPLAWGALGCPSPVLLDTLEVLLARLSRILSFVCMVFVRVCVHVRRMAGRQDKSTSLPNPQSGQGASLARMNANQGGSTIANVYAFLNAARLHRSPMAADVTGYAIMSQEKALVWQM